MNAITITARIAVVCAALVILSAGVLGYTALYDLFVSIGLFAAWLGIFFPLLFDLAEITAALAVFNAKLQGEEDRFAWIMVLLFTGLGITANVGHAVFAWWIGKITTPQVILAVFATSLFPLSVALVTHLIKRVIAQDISRRGVIKTLAELITEIDYKRAELAELLSQKQDEIDQKQSEVDRLNTQLAQTSARLEQVRNELKAAHFQQKTASVEEMNEARQAKIEARRANVLNLAREGMNPQNIASSLKVSLSTVKRDLNTLNGKVNVVQERGAFDRIVNAAHEAGRDDVAHILTTAKRGWDRVNAEVKE
ncbi:MAG: DUF2637 domain-containing protein [Anaerolineae bacterium]|nr:DUF2637 domain-containing protein [Anaerolineae bacterium]